MYQGYTLVGAVRFDHLAGGVFLLRSCEITQITVFPFAPPMCDLLKAPRSRRKQKMIVDGDLSEPEGADLSQLPPGLASSNAASTGEAPSDEGPQRADGNLQDRPNIATMWAMLNQGDPGTVFEELTEDNTLVWIDMFSGIVHRVKPKPPCILARFL